MGLVPGRLPSRRRRSPRRPGEPSRPATSSPHEFATATFWKSAPHATQRRTVRLVASDRGRARRHRPVRLQQRPQPPPEPFQFYASTANPHHLTVPTRRGRQRHARGLARSGRDTQTYVNGEPQFDTPNHQYDSSDFDQLVAAIPTRASCRRRCRRCPSSRLRRTRTATPPTPTRPTSSNSIAREIDALEQTPDWSSTAVMISYDDSDGWYDHVYSGVTNPSVSVSDDLTNATLGGHVGTVRAETSNSCAARERAGPLRPRPAAAADRRLAVGEVERRRPQSERPVLDHQLHRVQLEPSRDPRLGRPDSLGRRPE